MNISDYYIITCFSSQNNQASMTVDCVKAVAGECICVPTPDVFIDVKVMGEGDDSD